MSNFGLFSYVVVDPYHTPRLFVGEEQYITFVELCQPPPLICGDEGTRTPDFRLAKAALSQLSYIPRWLGDVAMLPGLGGPEWTRTTGLCVISTAL